MKSGLEGSYTTVERTKRQQEVLERLEAGMPVQKIANDLGVTRNAVYQMIDRLRLQGAVPHDFTASGQLQRGSAELLAGPATPSRLASCASSRTRPRPRTATPSWSRPRVAEGDVAALAYELGRLDAGGRGEVPAKLIESALKRRGIIPADE